MLFFVKFSFCCLLLMISCFVVFDSFLFVFVVFFGFSRELFLMLMIVFFLFVFLFFFFWGGGVKFFCDCFLEFFQGILRSSFPFGVFVW